MIVIKLKTIINVIDADYEDDATIPDVLSKFPVGDYYSVNKDDTNDKQRQY